ncbi:MAG: bifunctional aspartate kinase/diaminopimelate decarboxylase [Proteobacteria bacterium]|nr:bifunctional aspartate kinase/diaminopimelate decarboxylase [Pseudomonadota bacterium]
MKQSIVVLKFGGTSVQEKSCWQVISDKIKYYQDRGELPVIVCSALAGISNKLEVLITETQKSFDHKATAAIKKQHRSLLSTLDLSPSILDQEFSHLDELIQEFTLTQNPSPALKAKIMARGEYMLTTAGEHYLQKLGHQVNHVDVTTWLTANQKSNVLSFFGQDQHYLNASCEFHFDHQLQQSCLSSSYDVILTQGFLARDHHNHTVLLGRGGSDTSASSIAAKLQAKSLEIWTDVPGIFTANPKIIPSSRLLLQLSYEEAQELASSGAKVLHPRCIEPLMPNKIPLTIRWSEKPDFTTTTVISSTCHSSCYVKGISTKNSIYVFSMESIKMWQQTGFLAEIFSLFKKYHISCDTVSTSETNVTVTLNSEGQNFSGASFKQLTEEIKKICRLTIFAECTTISLVGRGIRSILHLLAPVMEAFKDKQVFAVSQAANDLNFSFTVEKKDGDALLKHLHRILFKKADAHPKIFGYSWQNIIAPPDPRHPPHIKQNLPNQKQSDLLWWQQQEITCHLEQLASGGEHPLPLYVYHLSTVAKKCSELLNCDAISHVFYSMKANPHPEIIRLIATKGFGFECVSLAEVLHLQDHLSHFQPNKILFTPHSAPLDEYQAAIDLGVMVTVDNLDLLQRYPDVFAHQNLFIRMDPGKPKGHHPHVRTAGDASKFGISMRDWPQICHLVKKLKINVIGFHAHKGSGIPTLHSWQETALTLIDLAKSMNTTAIIDIGGGFPVQELPDGTGAHPSFSLTDVNQTLKSIKQKYPDYHLAVEPGRYLVSEAGIILTKVHQVKIKNTKNYVGVDAGMHTLIRPALYGAYHHIAHLSHQKQANRSKEIVDIVGPICETGDVLGRSRKLPKVTPGDILVICGAGAYGRVMSSGYNLRGLPEEYVIHNT